MIGFVANCINKTLAMKVVFGVPFLSAHSAGSSSPEARQIRREVLRHPEDAAGQGQLLPVLPISSSTFLTRSSRRELFGTALGTQRKIASLSCIKGRLRRSFAFCSLSG